MKIAVSSTGKDLDCKIDPRFGRCAYFIIVEIENKEVKDSKTIKNPATEQSGGAGTAAAQLVGNEKVEAVITGNVGPNAFTTLDKLGIKVYQAEGTVKEVIEDFIEGELAEVEEPEEFGKA
jgi:predicted Fe-Mo cluster-binding NifX family protein